MALIKAYRIEGSDLYFEEYLHWTFTPHQTEAVQVWKLKNVDKTDLDKTKLEQLIAYQEDADFETEVVDGRTRLSVFTYFDHSEYFFNCDEVTTSKRPYSIDELSDMLVKSGKTWQDQDNLIFRQRQAIQEVEKFVDKEIDKKNRIIEQLPDTNSNAILKASHQLDILNQFKLLLDREQQRINEQSENSSTNA